MTKVVRCAEVTGYCPHDHVVRAETEDELLRAVAQHAREVHGLESVPPELVEKVKASTSEE